ncbi:MAG: hypothetical protein J6Y13_01555, partial [Treponema sp.]|nr:hypothetical protein [Treponema sp.]
MLTACTGNGGAANSNGELYNPNNIPVSSGSGAGSGSSGSSGGSSESFTAEDLLNAANSGDPGRIIELVSAAPAGDESGETTTIVLSAADLGLPANGTVTLTITGAISFDETKGAADDGTVTFIIPKVVTGKTVTLELSVKDETGFVIYYGKETGPVEGSGNLDITLHRRYRTHATADRTVLTATATSAELATITITGATETPQLTPSSSLLNTDPPVRDASDPETYTVSVGIPGGTAPVWFADDTAVSVTVKVGTEEHTIAFTLKNKYTVEVEYTASSGSITSSELSTPYMQGSSITFAAASGVVASTQGNRGVA